VFTKPLFTKKNQFFSVFATQGGQQQPRLGIVVAKRYVRLAVERNKLKRVIRESFRHQQKQLAGLDVVVVVKKNFVAQLMSKTQLPGFFVGLGDKQSSRCKS